MYNMVNTDVICPNCGKAFMHRGEPEVIKSSTETYVYLCTHCGFEHTAKSDEEMKKHANDYIHYKDVPKDDKDDPVNHPSHYETGKFESIDVMVETQGVESVQDFCVCNAFKYIYRHKRKNGVEDIKKAIWYLNKYVELEEGK